MRKLHLVLLISTLAIIATPIGASGEMTPLMGQIQIERPTWIPVASGAIELTSGGAYSFSIWRNPADCLLAVFHCNIPARSHPAIHGLFGSGGNNWIIDGTQIGDMWITVLTTFIHPSDYREERDIFKREGKAANEVIKKLSALGKITRWEMIH